MIVGPVIHRTGAALAYATLVAMMLAYAALAGWLALARHCSMETQALDMGYADQVTWNALHGRGLRFTVFRGPVGAEDGHPLQLGAGADRDSLLAFHVELLFFPIALLYLVHAGPETLIVLLTAGLALGALPVYWIACRRLGHRGAALAFAAMYLLFPSVQAANLADFHAVSLTAPILLFAFWALDEERHGLFVALALAAAAAKEEVGLVVAMLGLYAWLARGRRRLGLTLATAMVAWVALCFGVIMPHFNGGAPSLFTPRYADALAHLHHFAAALQAGRIALPVPGYTLGYALHLLAGTGFLAALGPLELATAAPALAVNGLSWSVWQHGGGAHYSAEVVPSLIVAAIAGTRRLAGRRSPLAGRLERRARVDAGRTAHDGGRFVRPSPSALCPPSFILGLSSLVLRLLSFVLRPWSFVLGLSSFVSHSLADARARLPGGPELALALAGLAIALAEARREGILPPSERFVWPAPSAHGVRLGPLLARIPPEAAVSAQSNVFPHLSDRPKIYVFPAIEDAEYVLVDVYGASDPLHPDELFTAVQALLADPQFELLAGDDGYLLFRRGALLEETGTHPTSLDPGAARRAAWPLPPSFYAFALPGERASYTPATGSFGELIDLAGYRLEPLPEVNFTQRRAMATVYLRARRPLAHAYRLMPFIIQPDGFVRSFDEGNATQLWYPTSRWRAGELVAVRFPPMTYLSGDRLGIGVQLGTGGAITRLPAMAGSGSGPGQERRVVDHGRVLELDRLP